MRRPRCRRGSGGWRGSSAASEGSDREERHDVGGMPVPPGAAGFEEGRGGGEPRHARIVFGEVGEERPPGVFDEESGELSARFVLGPNHAADPRHHESLGRPHDEAGDSFQETVSLIQREREFARRATAGQLSGHREPRRPDDEERDEAADDQEVCEPDLVELAVKPESGDEDQGEEEQEDRADRERPEAAVHPSPDRPRDLEPAVLEQQRVVVAVLVHAPHLHAPHAALVRGVRDGLEPQVDDAVREELFLEGRGGGLVSGLLRHEEARDPEVPQPFEETEGLDAPIIELEDQLEGVPRVDDEELKLPFPAELEDLCLEDREERLGARGRGVRHGADLCDHLLEVFAPAAQVEDRQGLRDGGRLEAKGRDVFQESAGALFQGDVEARHSLEGVVIEDVVGEGRLHRPARAADQDDMPLRDSASEDFVVEAADVGLHEGPGHGPHGLIARVTRNRPSSRTRAWEPVSCFAPRIFTIRRRRWASRSETMWIRSWITASARKSSSQRPWSTWPAMSQSGRSVTTKLVTARSRSHSNRRYISRRRSLNFARTSSASSESMTMRSSPRFSLIDRMPSSRARTQSRRSLIMSGAVRGSRTIREPFGTSSLRPRDPICRRRLEARSSRLR